MYYKDSSCNNSYFDATTKSTIGSFTAAADGPTCVKLKAALKEGDAKIKNCYFDNYPGGTDVVATGLLPETEYSFTFIVEMENGYKEQVVRKAKTKSLTLTTLQPKVVSLTCAIVAAETNISEFEPNVGFEWKKYDAPASLAPNQGFAAIYDGMLEGYIKNLQSAFYYNVRAFYKANGDKYYYGDWITFDPSDASFFEPTVHTYPITDIQATSVVVKGYVLAGTNNIIEQGVEYWIATGSKGVNAATRSDNEIMTVTSSGQVMTVTLENLLPSTTYVCRAFAKTEDGIKYGEEQKFTTANNPSGISEILNEDSTESFQPEIIGYYDLQGRKYACPQKGLNIIVYSDGSSRKIMIKQ